jgi:hypothetical protein
MSASVYAVAASSVRPEAAQEVGPGCSEVAVPGKLAVVAVLVQGFQPGVRAVGKADCDGPVQGHVRGRPVLDEQVAGRVAPEVPTSMRPSRGMFSGSSANSVVTLGEG